MSRSLREPVAALTVIPGGEDAKPGRSLLDGLPVVLTVPEAAKVLRLGRNACYDACAAGQIPTVKIGRRLLVPRHGLEKLLARASKED